MYRVKGNKHIFYKPFWFEKLMLSFSTKNFEWKKTKEEAVFELHKIKEVLMNYITQDKLNCLKAQYRSLKIYDEKVIIASRNGKPLYSFTVEELE